MDALIYISLFGGVLLLVYGIRQTGEGLQKAAGPHLKQFLSYLTKNRFLGLILGVIITVLTQSSSATIVLLVGFVSSGILKFPQTLGVILGADIGTTVTVQIISFKILDYSVLFIGLGLLAMYIGKREFWKDMGQALLGFGFIFLSMKIMSDAMTPLKDSEVFGLMITLLGDNPVMGILLAAAFTGIVQSSAATIGVAMSLATQGLIDLDHAIPVILGANIGTCATAVVAALSGPVQARRVAYAHTMFKVLGVLIFFPFMGMLALVVERTSDDLLHQIANAHTFFNVALAVIFLPFAAVMARLMERVVTEKPGMKPFGPKYLDETVLSTPSLALSQAVRETLRMADIVQDMMKNLMDAFKKRDSLLIEMTEDMDDMLDKLDRAIRFYLVKLSSAALSDDQSRREQMLIRITSNLENIGDIVDKNIMSLARKMKRRDLHFSADGLREIEEFYAKTMENFLLSVSALTTGDADLEDKVIKNRIRIKEMERVCRESHIERLKKGLTESFDTSAIHLDLLTYLDRINSYVTDIAMAIKESRGGGE
jgi:phosphate:Na+ symporter